MYRYIIFYLLVFIGLLVYFDSDRKNYNYLINEEAIPIRDNEEIKGMNYTIDIDDSINDKNIDVYSKIISSIYHYKDVSTIDNFFVNLNVDDDYKIEGINIVDNNNYIIRYVEFDKKSKDIIINLDREDFVNYNSNYDIKIKLKRNTRKI